MEGVEGDLLQFPLTHPPPEDCFGVELLDCAEYGWVAVVEAGVDALLLLYLDPLPSLLVGLRIGALDGA